MGEVVNSVTGTIPGGGSTSNLTVDFAVAFGVSTRPPAERVNCQLLRLYADGVLVYAPDLGFQGAISGMNITFHPGLGNADPDPTIRAAMGPNTPAFRDMIYAVIRGFPIAPGTSKLPSIRAEISDVAQQANPVLTDYNSTDLVVDVGGFADNRNNILYGFDNVTGAHKLRGYDMISRTKVSEVTVTGAGPFIAFGSLLYDIDNNLLLFQNGSTLSNRIPTAAMRIDNGQVISNFGVEDNSLTSDANGCATANCMDMMKYKAWGLTCYGVMSGGIFTNVNFIAYTHTPQLVPELASQFVVTDRGGLVQGNDLTLKWDTTVPIGAAPSLANLIDPSQNVTAICSYPVLDHEGLVAQYGLDQADFQDYIGLVAVGSRIYQFVCGLSLIPPNGIQNFNVVDTVYFHVKQGYPTLLADVGDAGKISDVFVNPANGQLVVITDGNGLGNKISAYNPRWTQANPGVGSAGPSGIYMTGLDGVYLNMPLSDYNAVGQRRFIRQSNLSSGLMGYEAGSRFIVIDLNTAKYVYRQLVGVGPNDAFCFNGAKSGVDFNRGSNTKVQHLDLYGPESATGVPLPDVLRWCAEKIGYTADKITSVGLDSEFVLGGYMDRATPVRQLLQTLSIIYNFNIVEGLGDTIQFTRTPRGAAASIALIGNEDISPLAEYASSGSGSGVQTGADSNPLKVTCAAPSDVPSDVSIGYIDPTMDFVSNTQIYRHVRFPFQTVKTNRLTNYTIPIVMQPAEALTRACRVVYATFASSIVYEFRLPHRFLALQPADVVTIQLKDSEKPDLIQVTQLTYNSDYSISVGGLNWSFNDNVSLPADAPLGHRTPLFHAPSDSVTFAFDVPLLVPTDEPPVGAAVVYSGVGSLGQSWWEGAEMFRAEGTASPIDLYLASQNLPYGNVDVALPQSNAAGNTFQTDNTTVVTIFGRSIDSSKFNSTAVLQDFHSGVNAAFIGQAGRWELVYYQNVTVLNGNSFSIQGLMRGRRGTEQNCDLHTTGDLFIPITKNIRQDILPIDALGQTLTYTARGLNTTQKPVSTTFTLAGNSEKPWAPVRQKATLASNFNLVNAPDYTNACGGGPTSGGPDRHNIITVTANCVTNPIGLVDGATGTSAVGIAGLTNALITFDFRPFGFKQRITEYSWYQASFSTFGTFDFEGSNDGIAWTTLDAGTAIGFGGPQVVTFVNPNGYLIYRLRQTTGTTTAGGIAEITFKTMSSFVSNNDLAITWIRRSRLGLEWVTNIQPLGEQSEKYQLEIQNGSGSVLRTITGLTVPAYTYLATDQTTDGFTPPLVNLVSQLEMTVQQVSQTVGLGYPGHAKVFIGA